MRVISMAALGALMLLAACAEETVKDAAPDRFAGLDVAIRAWRTDILAADAACLNKSKEQGCQAFTVACKGERELAPEDRAQGVSEKVVAAMSWDAWDPVTAEYRSEIGFAEFRKSGAAWSRTVGPRVNLESCATL